MSIYDDITAGMKSAMLAKDSVKLNTMRSLKAALQTAQLAKGNVHEPLSEQDAQAVVRKQIKQREDSISMYRQAGAEEQAQKEEQEKNILAAMLPAELTEAEILPVLEAVVTELGATSKKDMGRVMKEMQVRTQGCAPGKLLSQLVASRLG